MKKLALIFAGLFCSFSILAALPNRIDDFEVNVPLFKGATEFGVSALYLKANSPELQFANDFQFDPDTDLPVAGRLHSGQPAFAFGYEVFLGYQFACTGNDIRLVYTQFDNKNTDKLALPFEIFSISDLILSIPPEIAITIDFPEFGDADLLLVPANDVPISASFASASTQFKEDILDLEFGQYMNIDNFVRVRFYGGLRNARVRLRQNTSFLYEPRTITEVGTTAIADVDITTTVTLNNPGFAQNLKESSHFDGLGPRIGMNGVFHIGGNFGLVADLSAALLVGTVDSAASQEFQGSLDFTVTDVTITPTPVDVSLSLPEGSIVTVDSNANTVLVTNPDDVRIVPNLQGKLAINYTFPLRCCRTVDLELGYTINHYFNALDRIEILEGFDTDTIDANFEGPYLSLRMTL